MNNLPRFCPLQFLVPIAALAFGGCAHNALYFGTSNSISAEISGTTTAPTKVSVGYHRSEVALVPPRKDGMAHSVFGKMDYDFSWFDGLALEQVFATGEAAVAAASHDNFETEIRGGALDVKRKGGDRSTVEPGSNQDQRLFFATNTRVGLNLDLGQSLGQSVPSFLFGFRRDEATIVPVADANREVSSVFADLSIVVDRGGTVRQPPGDGKAARSDIGPDRLPGSKDGIRIKQRFATGRAALLAATEPGNREKLGVHPLTAKQAFDETAANGAVRDRARKVTDATEQGKILRALATTHPTAKEWDWKFFINSGFTKMSAADRGGLDPLLPQ